MIPYAGKFILKYQDLCETYQIDFGLHGDIIQIQTPDKVKPIERRMPLGTHRIDEGCINCAACADVCPVDAISEQNDVYVIDKEICVDCGACDSVCPVDVIKWEITA